MTIMNGKIRAELTELLVDHLNEQHCIRIIQGKDAVTTINHFEAVAEDVMDFIYGSEDSGNVPQPECSPYQEIPTDTRSGVQWSGDLTSCCNGFTCGCCPGSVDRLEGGPMAGPSVMYGVMTQEPLRASFVFPDHPSLTGEYVRLRGSDSEPKAQ